MSECSVEYSQCVRVQSKEDIFYQVEKLVFEPLRIEKDLNSIRLQLAIVRIQIGVFSKNPTACGGSISGLDLAS